MSLPRLMPCCFGQEAINDLYAVGGQLIPNVPEMGYKNDGSPGLPITSYALLQKELAFLVKATEGFIQYPEVRVVKKAADKVGTLDHAL